MVTGRVLGTRSKQEPSARSTARKSLLGRWLHRQSKGEPLVQNKTKKRHGQMASTLKSAARSTAKKVVRAVPALQHACCPQQMCTCAPTTVRTGSTQPGGAKSLQHTERKRVSFTHSKEDKATCSCSRLQQRPSSLRGLLQYAHRARVLHDWWACYGCWERWSLHEAWCLWALHFEYLQYCR